MKFVRAKFLNMSVDGLLLTKVKINYFFKILKKLINLINRYIQEV